MNVKDKKVIITGAGAGIGAASAKLFAKHGAQVVCADLNIENAKAIAEEINAAGGKAVSFEVNVAKYEQVEAMIKFAVAEFGQLDVIVNNAGIGPRKLSKTAKHDLEDWDRVISVNQTGVFYCMKLALQQMVEQGHGNIVNIASLAGLKASGSNISYSASKFAVVGMTKSAAMEYGSKNIRINAVCPGYTQTNLFNQLITARPDIGELFKNLTPMKRFGEPMEIAEAVVWLASENTSFITGQTITLDGGLGL